MSTPQAFWQTLLAAKSRLSDVLVGTTAILDCIALDVKPIAVALYETINIPVPSNVRNQVINPGNADPVFNDYNVASVPIVLNQHLQYGTTIRNFDLYASADDIVKYLLQPGIAGVAEQASQYITSLLNPTNFSVNPVVATTGSSITTGQFVSGGYNALLNQRVAVRDSANMSFIQQPNVYSKQLLDPLWTQESIVGINVAQQAKVEGGIKYAYGCRQDVDQNMPTSGVIGIRTFTSAYFSRSAIAAAMRAIPPGDPRVSDTTYIPWKGLLIRVTLSWSGTKDAWLLNIDTGFGASPVRPEQCVLFSTTEN